MDSKVMKYRGIRGLQSGIFSLLAVMFFGISAAGQSDPFGEMDHVYGDSVLVRPGMDVSIRFSLTNDEELGSFSIPLSFDTSILKLKSVTFEKSRVEYIVTKIIDSIETANANGKFIVAVIRFFEDAIPAGDGLVFSCIFSVSPEAKPGTITFIDSTFIPPGNELILSESITAQGIIPIFTPGKVEILGDNRAPLLTSQNDISIFEGDSISLQLTATDPDNDSVVISITSLPIGAKFTDNGDGTAELVWQPGFVGPNSADNSPYTITMSVSDGQLTSEQTFVISVTNVNRTPVITAPDTVSIEAGELAKISISAQDPDFEEITWQIINRPEGSSFDNANPATFSWTPPLFSTGSSTMQILASDPWGATDTTNMQLNVTAATIYSLLLDTVGAFSNEELTFKISLDNKVPITGFDLVVYYDPTGVTLVDGTNVGTRSEGFEQFDISTDEYGVNGNVRITAKKDLSGNGVLAAGKGPLALFTFRTSGDLALAGQNVPIRFLNEVSRDDNTLFDSTGAVIGQTDITSVDGSVQIYELGEVIIGDINLNGLSIEISDVIYFTNYFINPSLFPFNALQFANSDVNGDKLAASLADLITLIRMVVEGPGGSFGPKAGERDELEISVSSQRENGVTTITADSPLDLAGVFLTITTNDEIKLEDIKVIPSDMTYGIAVNDNEIRLIIYSWGSETLPAGKIELLSFPGENDINIENVELVDSDGQQLSVSFNSINSIIPDDFFLDQNYPNPFNPTTIIGFGLPQASNVQLAVFNLLGQTVVTLENGTLPAGIYQREWDGRGNDGNSVASGVYFYRLMIGDQTLTRKMLLMK